MFQYIRFIIENCVYFATLTVPIFTGSILLLGEKSFLHPENVIQSRPKLPFFWYF